MNVSIANTPTINTYNDLILYIRKHSDILDAIPLKLFTESTLSGKKFLALCALVASKSADLQNKIITLLDPMTCPEPILDFYALNNNIPLPDLLSDNNVLTDISDSDSASGVVTITHDLCTHDYIGVVQHQVSSVWYQSRASQDTIVKKARTFSFNVNTVTGEVGTVTYRVLFVYKRSYLKAKRLICANIGQISRMRNTLEGVDFYLKLLLHNRVTLSIVYYPRLYPILQFYSDTSKNSANTWFSSRARTGGGFTDPPSNNNGHLGPGVSLIGSDADITPRAAADTVTEANIQTSSIEITLETDVTTGLEDFIQESIRDYFLPFPSLYDSAVQYLITSYTSRWSK